MYVRRAHKGHTCNYLYYQDPRPTDGIFHHAPCSELNQTYFPKHTSANSIPLLHLSIVLAPRSSSRPPLLFIPHFSTVFPTSSNTSTLFLSLSRVSTLMSTFYPSPHSLDLSILPISSTYISAKFRFKILSNILPFPCLGSALFSQVARSPSFLTSSSSYHSIH